jgi:hypothetical protein
MATHQSSPAVIAERTALASALVGSVGIVCLVLLYVGLLAPAKKLLIFGPLNDICVLVQYALALPTVLALHRVLRTEAPKASLCAMIAATVGIAGVVVFQGLLLLGLMSFRAQVGGASASVLLVGCWIVMTWAIGRRRGVVPTSPILTLVAALYFGYPVWINSVGKRFRQTAVTTAAAA